MIDIFNEYFLWLCDKVGAADELFHKLLWHLYTKRFIFEIDRDSNRASDGKSLRWQFHLSSGIDKDAIDWVMPEWCSILEMMVALSMKCEGIMDDPTYGDRTGEWFGSMLRSLGLNGQWDEVYDPDLVEDILENFLSHNYEPDGRGGLFTIKNCRYDLRNEEIWYQMNWYLNTILF